MKKLLILITILLITLTGFAQTQNVINWDRYGITGDLSVGKGNANRNDSNAYPPRGVYFQVGPDTGNKAMLPPRILHPDSISNPLIGMIAFSYSDSSLKVYNGLNWVSLDSSGGGGSSYVFSNGLTDSLGEVKWGGNFSNVNLTGTNTTIDINQAYGTRWKFYLPGSSMGSGFALNNDIGYDGYGGIIRDDADAHIFKLWGGWGGPEGYAGIAAGYSSDSKLGLTMQSYKPIIMSNDLAVEDFTNDRQIPTLLWVKKAITDSIQYKSDSSTISNDSLFYWVRGVPYYGGSFSGGSGGVDTATIQSIIEDSLSGVIRQGGNSFGVAMDIGTNDNQDVIIRRNNAQFARFAMSPIGMYRALYLSDASPVQNNLTIATNSTAGATIVQGNNTVFLATGGIDVTNVRVMANATGMGIGRGVTSNPAGVRLFVQGGSSIFQGASATVGLNGLFVSYANDSNLVVANDGRLKARSLQGADTAIVAVDTNGNIHRKSIPSLPFVPEGAYLTYTDPNNELIPADNSVIVVTLTGDASIILPDNPPVKSRAILKVFGSANALTITPSSGGTIDEEPNIMMTPKEGRTLLHIGDNEWIILNQ